jgi:DNA (cytosine-5)-methyltransferase 1
VAVPGVSARLAANHWSRAIESHAANFPATEHYQGDLHAADLEGFPAADIFWASPECPQWSVARGRRREFDKQPDLFGEVLSDEAADRSRALMWDVPRYLEAMKLRGRPVLAGVVENVTDVRAWAHWHAWVASIRNLGYRTRLIALNSMHARPAATPPAPQSRDRLYLAYLDNLDRYLPHSGLFRARGLWPQSRIPGVSRGPAGSALASPTLSG